ncbi:TlpA family protein disulfide reductase [Carboxylicivirga sp. A043]|uniref:TlpA disulfide reductase family protein n=1 Tax=Carboxylicivirga litoralis TaxID=2816963 RepID=UPI0021CB5E05|nr:TlpA disulfide reductase family protein [Carboxylicivirga sp. A043]MCU4156051.1 TlpA family protein disulfide reductase [Carboxylicivirga sp. A043]
MKTKVIPYIITFCFIGLLISTNAISRWQQTAIFRHYDNIDEPIRKVLEQDDFLTDESHNSIFVINLWATWCQPCAKEIPHLNKLVDKYEKDGVLFLAINAEKEKEVIEWLDLQKHDFIYFHLHNHTDLANYLFQLNPDTQYKTGQKPQHLPTNLIIKNGEIVYYKTGYSENNIQLLEEAIRNCI